MLNGNPGNNVLKMVHAQVKELSGTRPKFRQDQCNFYPYHSMISCMEHWSPQNILGFCIPRTTVHHGVKPLGLQGCPSHRQLKGFHGFWFVENQETDVEVVPAPAFQQWHLRSVLLRRVACCLATVVGHKKSQT